MSDYILAFDVGGTVLKIGAVDLNGNLLHTAQQSSRPNDGPEVLLKTFIQETYRINSALKGKMLGIGLSLSGVIDPDQGVVFLPGKVKMLENFPLVPHLKEEFDVPVLAGNDGRLAAYAEKYFGLAKNVDWAVVLTIGTGIGSGVIINGKLITNRHLQFGTQAGHLIIDKRSDLLCLTGNFGTAESACSANALSMQVKNAIQRGLPSVLTDEFYASPASIDFKRVTEACRLGDELCLKELDIWIGNLQALLINTVHAYGPDKIILCGGATLASDLFLPVLIEGVNRKTFRFPATESISIEISRLQQYSSMVGAAALLMEKLHILKHDRVDQTYINRD